MASYRITLKRTAIKDLRSLPKNMLGRVQALLDKLSTEPRPRGTAKIQGEENMYRLRLGDYRIIYTLDDSTRTLDVLFIRHRRDVYKLL
jgi:mRNA interferase RelE/StbE